MPLTDEGAKEVQEILELHRQRAAAIVQADVSALGRLLSARYWHVHGGGTIDTKAAFIEKRARPDYTKYKSLDFSDVRVVVYTGTALVRGNMDVVEAFPDGRDDKSFRVRFTNLWAREEDGAWRCVHSHSCVRTTPAADLPAPPQ